MQVKPGRQYRFVGNEGIGRLSDEVVTVVEDPDGNLAFLSQNDRDLGLVDWPWIVNSDGTVDDVGNLTELA